MKKLISVVLAVVMLMSVATLAMTSVSAATTNNASTGTSGTIYFDSTGWNNVNDVYCHIWVRGGDAFYPWMNPSEKCEKVSGNLWSYDLSKLDAATQVTGGMKSGVDYCVIFVANTRVQTYDTTFNLSCVDDIAYLTGNKIENPVDSNKSSYEAVWTDNSSSFGPHLAITSIGNIVGKVLCPNEKGYKVIGDWLPSYYTGVHVDPVETMASCFAKFGVDTVEELAMSYNYMLENNPAETQETYDKWKSQLEEAFAIAFPEKSKEAEDSGKDLLNDDELEDAKNAVNQSGTGDDGVDYTVLFILLGVMLVAGTTVVVTRRRRED